MELFLKLWSFLIKKKSLIVLILAKGLFHGSIIVSVPPSHFFYQQNYTQKKEIYKLNFWKLSDFGSFQFTESEEKKKGFKMPKIEISWPSCINKLFACACVQNPFINKPYDKLLDEFNDSLYKHTLTNIYTFFVVTNQQPWNELETRGVSHYGLAIYIKIYILRQKKRIREIQIFYHANI